ncbi:hypothetical protein J4G33_14560 [Actinotalea sp. BY-33]|uniref:Uncharacterized protein n=1 Tax=Actinotalea soli TaxID=2819234 RepID=A0A939LXF7_9CELL|nr:hypothetical protein [Actinotalea soli]MBO1753032.1 hypothetical protein [Actinotalea soli]
MGKPPHPVVRWIARHRRLLRALALAYVALSCWHAYSLRHDAWVLTLVNGVAVGVVWWTLPAAYAGRVREDDEGLRET